VTRSKKLTCEKKAWKQIKKTQKKQKGKSSGGRTDRNDNGTGKKKKKYVNNGREQSNAGAEQKFTGTAVGFNGLTKY